MQIWWWISVAVFVIGALMIGYALYKGRGSQTKQYMDHAAHGFFVSAVGLVSAMACAVVGLFL